MRNDPQSFRDIVFLRYYGSYGKTVGDQRKLNDALIRYGKHIPGLGTGYGLLEEFVKDGRNWPGGMEHQKDQVTAILNRCPECWDAFAGEAYDILRRGKAGSKRGYSVSSLTLESTALRGCDAPGWPQLLRIPIPPSGVTAT